MSASHRHHPEDPAASPSHEASANRGPCGDLESWYRTLFEYSGTAMVVLEKKLSIHSFNGEFARLSGVSSEELRSPRTLRDLVHADDYERIAAYHEMRCRNHEGEPTHCECRLVTCQGEPRHVSLRTEIIPGTSLTIISLVDISDRIRTEEAYRQSQERIKRLLDNMPGLAYSIENDASRTISMVSRGAKEFTGFDAEMLVGKGFADHFEKHIHPDDAAAVRKALETALDAGRAFESVFRLQMASGDYKWVRNHGIGVYSSEGQLLRLEGLVTDIDASKQAELDLSKENQRLRSSIKERFRFGSIVGRSEAMQQVYDMILRAAASDANVIVYGESGTGKELVSRAIHDLSDRQSRPFVPVNCGAIPESLWESEFFGYKKGAFTGANRDKEGFFDLAHGGTLFLDEIGEIVPTMQAKLLRAIEGGGYTPVGAQSIRKVDIRIIAATNRDTMQMVRDGRMREDFYYRIHVIPVHLPPLRDRRLDIPLLVEHFLSTYGDVGLKHQPLPATVMDRLMGYDWPGNVRELQNVLHRYVTLGKLVMESRAGDALSVGGQETGSGKGSKTVKSLAEALDQFEKDYIYEQLQHQRWHVSQTAALLEVDRRTLQRKMKRLGLYQ